MKQFGKAIMFTALMSLMDVKSFASFSSPFSSNLKTIVSLIEEPFEIDQTVFYDDFYQVATLYVPVGTKEKYMSTEGWNNFVNIEEATGINDVKRETTTNNRYYTLDGRQIVGKPTVKGIYIHNGRKVMVK